MLRGNSQKIAGLRSPKFLNRHKYGKAVLQIGDFALCGIINE
jgi:hypothetical protein